MSVNKYLPHIFILPEDDANRQLANGFLLEVSTRQIQVLSEVGGWARVLDCFNSDHIVGMETYGNRYIVLLIDFDNDANRRQRVKNGIPTALASRVFVLGTLSEPEELKRAGLGTYEAIGKAIARDCRGKTRTVLEHDLLRHNEDELACLRDTACDTLFQ